MRSGIRLLPMFLAWLIGSLSVLASAADAATNFARAGVGGLDNGTIQNGDGTGPARITINAIPLALVKQARDAGGTVLPDSAGVRPDQELWFVLWVDNPAPFPAVGVRVTDLLDETQFTYLPGTVEHAVLGSGASDTAIWNGFWQPLTDSVGAPDDVASMTDSGGSSTPERLTIGDVVGQVNVPLNVPPASLRAFRFRVRVN